MKVVVKAVLEICGARHCFDGNDTKLSVIAKLGEPQSSGTASGKHKRPRIFVYDGIEFHFEVGKTDADEKLALIFRDNDGEYVDLCLPFISNVEG